MPSTVTSITPPPLSSYIRVTLCGGGPESYVDCATLSFQVPMRGSLSCADRLMTETTSVRTTPNVNVRSSDCIVLLLPAIALPNRFSWLNDDCPTLLDAALHRFHLLKRLMLSRSQRGSGNCRISETEARTCLIHSCSQDL